MRIDPWSSQQSTDYQRLRDEFGIEEFAFADRLPGAPRLVRRGVIFGHRGFDLVMRAIDRHDPWGVLTGLMPSGPMHIGHKMVIDQVAYYQGLGADVSITIADVEAYVTRGMSIERCREIAIENYVKNYFALGLAPERLQIYFQSSRAPVKDLAWKLGKRVNWSAMQAIYGFDGETNMGHTMAPLVQVGDILHTELPAYGGPRPIVVPVGVDQDPHIRLTRDLAQASRLFNVQVHEEPKLGRVVGVFVKVDDDVDGLLQKARAALETVGFADFKVNPKYKALYVRGGAADVPVVDAALASLESRLGQFGFLQPAATYHRFMSGLTGGKMSSSKPETHIALDETPESAAKKISGAQTGGRASAEEQRRLGGEPDRCMVYETYVYHLVDDDKELRDLYDRCKTGTMLCGECKAFAKDRVVAFLKGHRERKAATEHLVAQTVRAD